MEIDRFLSDGDTVFAGGLEADVVHTSCHSPGSICLTVEDDRPVVICGHGPSTTIGEERRLNPFVGEA